MGISQFSDSLGHAKFSMLLIFIVLSYLEACIVYGLLFL